MAAARASGSGVVLLAAATAALFVPAVPGAAWATPPPLGSACTIEGTTGPDTLNGTSGSDVICGYAGDDTIDGMGGDDLIIGGAGADNLLGGDGDDDIRGGSGVDTLTGNADNDSLYGDGDADSVDGGDGDDVVTGGSGDDTLNGGTGADTLWGQAGLDTANGGDGADKVDGGADADVLHGNVGADKVNGAAGDDDLYGDEDNDVLRGGDGNDDHFGGTGDDTVYDQDGVGFADTVTCGDGVGDAAFVDTFDSVNVDCESDTAIDRDDPVAVDDTKTVNEDVGPRKIEVLANDTDADGGPISITSASDPAHGTVTVGGSKKRVFYTPDPNYCNTPPGTTPDTFTYTLAPGGSTATVRVKVACRPDNPTATDDPSTVLEDAAATTIDVLGNDSDPDSVGLLINTVTQPTHGTVVKTNGGADLTYQPAANYCNDGVTTDDFDYTLTNGGDTGTVKMTVTCVQDDPIAGNDATTVLEDAAATTINVLTNDSDADGDAFHIQSTTDPAHGTVVITNGGADLTYQPDANYCNNPPGTTLDTFDYTLTPGTNSATVTVTVTCVNDNPVADDESFSGTDSAVGNTVLVVNDPTDGAPSEAGPHKAITGDILNGDTDIDSVGPLTVTAETKASADGGSVTIEADGDFVFTPKAATSCTDHSDSFDYTVNDGDGGSDAGTVTVAIANCVWYVNNNAAGNSGLSNAPFDTLAQAQTPSAAGDTIYVYQGDGTTTGYAAGIVLKANQRLLGDSVDLTVGADTLATGTAGHRPKLTANNTDVVALDDNNLVEALQIDPQGTGGGIDAETGDNAGTITDVRIIDTGTAGTQPSLQIEQTSGTFAVSDITIDNSAATGQTIGSEGIRAGFNSGTVTFADTGTISVTNKGALGVDIASTNVGTSVFDSVTVTASGSGGISLNTVNGTTTYGAVNLTTTGGTGFFGTSGGTVNVTGANNTIASTSGRALSLQSTGIGASNMTFKSISASGGDAGIVLNGTLSGHLIVTGSGGTCTNADTSGCSGGTIANTTGADTAGAIAPGTGIVLNATSAPSFTRMWIHDHSNYGIRGTDVLSFTLANSVVNGLNGDSLTDDDSSALFNQLTGTASITDSYFAGGCTDNLWVDNTSGGVTVNLTNTTFGASAGVCGPSSVQRPTNDAVTLETEPGAAQINATVTGSTFQSAAGDLLQYTAQGGSSGSLTVTGNTFNDGHPQIATGGGGLSVSSSATTPMNFQSNSFRGAVGAGVLIVKLTGSSTQTGTFSNNSIGVSGVANSGSAEGSALKLQNVGGGTDSWTVSNNQIYGYNNFGVEVEGGGGAVAQNGAINTNITNNTIAEPGNTVGTQAIPKNGVHLNIGTVVGDTFVACAGITGNTLDQSGADAVPATGQVNDVRLRQRQATTIKLPGYAGANNDNTAVQNFVDSNNAGTVTVLAGNTVPTGGGYVGGAACVTP